jgi:hypothetical protein
MIAFWEDPWIGLWLIVIHFVPDKDEIEKNYFIVMILFCAHNDLHDATHLKSLKWQATCRPCGIMYTARFYTHHGRMKRPQQYIQLLEVG